MNKTYGIIIFIQLYVWWYDPTKFVCKLEFLCFYQFTVSYFYLLSNLYYGIDISTLFLMIHMIILKKTDLKNIMYNLTPQISERLDEINLYV